MSFGARLKEKREELGLKQSELGEMLGITGSAIGNYENGISSPKADVLYKVFDVLKCDANYLFQDEMAALHEANATPDEMEHLVKKYRSLDPYGKEAVDGILDVESRRCEAGRREQKDKATPVPNDSLSDEEKDFMNYVKQLNHGQQEMILGHLQQLTAQRRVLATASTQAEVGENIPKSDLLK